MFPEVQDYGIIFILLAVFGFIILDTYKTGRDFGIPDIYKSTIDHFFHYISVAFIVSSLLVVLIALLLTAPDQENVFTNVVKAFFTGLERAHELEIINTENYETILNVFIYYSFFAPIYIIFYFFALILGLLSRYTSNFWINVHFKENTEPIKFVGIITETEDFFFFEKEEFNKWEAVRKDDIVRIERITAPARVEILMDKILKKLRSRKKPTDKNNKK